MKMLKNLRQRGYGLIEVILAIAITLGLIVGGIVLFNQSQLASNTTDAARAVVTISSESRALYRTAPDFDGSTAAGDELDNDQLIGAGGVPTNLVDGSVINMPYEGTLVVATGTDTNTFDVTLSWPTGNSNAVSLCNRLAAPIASGGSGPLGVGYAVTPTCTDDGTTGPSMVANFTR